MTLMLVSAICVSLLFGLLIGLLIGVSRHSKIEAEAAAMVKSAKRAEGCAVSGLRTFAEKEKQATLSAIKKL